MNLDEKENLFRETDPGIFSTDPDDPEEGRTFIWAWTEWFERIEADNGAVSFTPVADSEPELQHWLRVQKCDRGLTEIVGDFARDVKSEFLEQVPLFPEAPETSSEAPFSEQRPDEDVEHY